MNALQLIENTYTDISVETIHQYIVYDTDGYEDCDEGVLGLSIMWDYENEEIDDLMGNEYHPKLGQKINLMWIEKIKEMSNWKLGDKLYIFTKCKSDGNFDCWFSKNKESVGWSNIIVEKTGYVCVRYFNHYTMDEDDEDGIKWNLWVRAESVYNDKNCDVLEKKDEVVLEKTKQKYTCVCGSVIKENEKKRHFKTKKHQNYLAENPDK